ncbi:MAG TPA: pantoate--beta-alanine ligase [Cytophagaceae bacterium]|jgi:pantoate--beta-alanine ligase|nr:pantoate--beta-alanine ligase [Cytophagaceae bacterium]
MIIIEDPSQLISLLKKHKADNKKTGLVPTMGALHQGHASLFQISATENDVTIATIFVNPIQFNNPADLEKYPRTLDKDIEIMEKAGCDMVFTPSREIMYPSVPVININFGRLEEVMEGKFRPGHFNGVAIVVAKIFNMVQPDNAYFGQKDLQQYLVIRQMVKDLSFQINIKACPVIREADGLAMSSRNMRLNIEMRKKAPKIKEALDLGAKLIAQHSPATVKEKVKEFISNVPELDLEYFEIADSETLAPVNNVKEHKGIALCIAAHLDEVRLIDNILLIS